MRRSRRSSWNRAFTELLEVRQLPAGNVLVQLTGGELNIRGDAAANELRITQMNGNTIVAAADDSTRINGQNGPVTLAGMVQRAFISLGGGDDRIIFGMAADDEFQVASHLKVDLGGGGNTLESVGHLRVGGRLTVESGSGDDQVLFRGRVSTGGDVTFSPATARALWSLMQKTESL